jgi:hypothetical protein
MCHLMWLTTLCFVCYLSAINYVAAAPIDSADEAAVKFRFNYINPGFVIFSHVPIILVHQRKSAIKPADLAIRIILICCLFACSFSFRRLAIPGKIRLFGTWTSRLFLFAKC